MGLCLHEASPAGSMSGFLDYQYGTKLETMLGELSGVMQRPKFDSWELSESDVVIFTEELGFRDVCVEENTLTVATDTSMNSVAYGEAREQSDDIWKSRMVWVPLWFTDARKGYGSFLKMKVRFQAWGPFVSLF
ncbi:hypothetical protein Gotur_030920 [Gossypium turneri]